MKHGVIYSLPSAGNGSNWCIRLDSGDLIWIPDGTHGGPNNQDELGDRCRVSETGEFVREEVK